MEITQKLSMLSTQLSALLDQAHETSYFNYNTALELLLDTLGLYWIYVLIKVGILLAAVSVVMGAAVVAKYHTKEFLYSGIVF